MSANVSFFTVIRHLSCFKFLTPEIWKMVRFFNICLVLICRAKKFQVLIHFRILNNILSFLLNMDLYIIFDFRSHLGERHCSLYYKLSFNKNIIFCGSPCTVSAELDAGFYSEILP